MEETAAAMVIGAMVFTQMAGLVGLVVLGTRIIYCVLSAIADILLKLRKLGHLQL